ncbi:hypothetical protein HMPREF9069_00952 [Atopobium sp. oral taxon 810 str. F0209]|nr:hypothetical protein HMPREF9069_00952 [Atopobium sp. oral taxon 810 str. F0209]
MRQNTGKQPPSKTALLPAGMLQHKFQQMAQIGPQSEEGSNGRLFWLFGDI